MSIDDPRPLMPEQVIEPVEEPQEHGQPLERGFHADPRQPGMCLWSDGKGNTEGPFPMNDQDAAWRTYSDMTYTWRAFLWAATVFAWFSVLVFIGDEVLTQTERLTIVIMLLVALYAGWVGSTLRAQQYMRFIRRVHSVDVPGSKRHPNDPSQQLGLVNGLCTLAVVALIAMI